MGRTTYPSTKRRLITITARQSRSGSAQ